jgi:(2Fe-2S) ferredoxin
MEPFRIHLFVCTKQKPDGATSCAAKGSAAVVNALDREIRARGLSNDVQMTTCGCMGLCDEGPVMVVYPEGIWYRRVQPLDVPEIVGQHLLAGKPVTRFIWDDAPAMKAMSVEHGEKFSAVMAARERAGVLAVRQNPHVGRDAGVVEHVRGQADDSLDQIVLQHVAANLTLPAPRATGEQR